MGDDDSTGENCAGGSLRCRPQSNAADSRVSGDRNRPTIQAGSIASRICSMTNLKNISRTGQRTKWYFSRFYLFPTSALVVVVGAAEALVAPGLRVPEVPGAVPGSGVQAGVDLQVESYLIV